MSVSYNAYGYVGFEVTEADFWQTLKSDQESCEKGHVKDSTDPFCPKDGTRFAIGTTEVPSDVLKAMVRYLDWKGEDWSYHYSNLHEDHLRSLTYHHWSQDRHEKIGLVMEIPEHRGKKLGVGVTLGELERAFEKMIDLRDRLGLQDRVVKFYLSLQVS